MTTVEHHKSRYAYLSPASDLGGVLERISDAELRRATASSNDGCEASFWRQYKLGTLEMIQELLRRGTSRMF